MDLKRAKKKVSRMKNGTKMLNLMYQRKKAGLTQGELAEKVGVKRLTIWAYESGRRKPNQEMLERLAVALNCTVADLL